MAFGHDRKTHSTFQFVVVRVGREQHIRKELLKAVPSVARPVFHVRSHGLVELHEEILRWGAELLNYLVPLVDV